MKKILVIVAIATACLAPAAVYSQAAQSSAPASAAASPKPYYTTDETTIGDLLDNPATKAILLKYIPTIVNNPQIEQGRAMTLKGVQGYAPDVLTDETLAKIDAELKSVPAPKS